MKNNKRFKKIYLEITNACNLSCTFCIKNQRKINYLSEEEFKTILNKLEPYTNYLYFHVLGEPLMHPMINEFINIASKSFKVMITTNGYLTDKIENNKNIRQVNISIHSFNDKYGVSIEDYMHNIFKSVDKLVKNNTYISLRLWVKNDYQKKIIEMINEYYNCNVNLESGSYKIKEYLYIKSYHEFIWPDLSNDYYEEVGTCYGLKDHIGILSNGTIIPCCLDSKGVINLGNIYDDNLDEVLNKERVLTMMEGFRQCKKIEELCKHCSFLE